MKKTGMRWVLALIAAMLSLIHILTSEVEYILRLANELSGYDAPFTEGDVSNYFVKECDKCGSQYGFDEFYPDDEEIEIEKDEDGTYMCPVCGLYRCV